jgi:hypothetical protein
MIAEISIKSEIFCIAVNVLGRGGATGMSE